MFTNMYAALTLRTLQTLDFVSYVFALVVIEWFRGSRGITRYEALKSLVRTGACNVLFRPHAEQECQRSFRALKENGTFTR
jgi:hypothetical protein